MSENTTQEKGLFETLEDRSRSPEYCSENSKHSHDHAVGLELDECKFEFLVQDMFLDHFFP